MSQTLQKFSDAYEKLNERERRLVLAVGVMLSAMVVFYGSLSALDSLAMLDARINRLQQNILNVNNQIAHRASIESQYSAVAAQHSSAWTEAEIHDRLRGEIYRLAQNFPSALNSDGIPEEITNRYGDMVTIPTIQQGNLTEGLQGYREYTLGFGIPSAPFESAINFIDRLQNSPQSLRIDGIEIDRQPLDTNVAINLTITRTVVAGIKQDVKAPDVTKPEMATEPGIKLQLADWKAEGATAEEVAGGGAAGNALVVKGQGIFYWERSLPSGVSFELEADILASGSATLGVSGNLPESVYPGAEALNADNAPYTYRVVFTTAEASGGRSAVRAPFLQLQSPESEVRLNRLVLRKIGE